MQHSLVTLKNILFDPFKELKNEPSFNFVIGITLFTTIFATVQMQLSPEWSIGFAFSLLTKVGMNLLMTIFSLAIYAWFASLITVILFKKRCLSELFVLTAISGSPVIFTAAAYIIAQAMGYDMSFSFALGSTTYNYTWLGLFVIVWGIYIQAGGLKYLFEISTLKAVLLASLFAVLPLGLFYFFTSAILPFGLN